MIVTNVQFAVDLFGVRLNVAILVVPKITAALVIVMGLMTAVSAMAVNVNAANVKIAVNVKAIFLIFVSVYVSHLQQTMIAAAAMSPIQAQRGPQPGEEGKVSQVRMW